MSTTADLYREAGMRLRGDDEPAEVVRMDGTPMPVGADGIPVLTDAVSLTKTTDRPTRQRRGARSNGGTR